MKNRFIFNKKIIFLMIYCLLILSFTVVYAWYENTHNADISVSTTPYTLDMKIGFVGDDTSSVSDYYNSTTKLITLNGLKKSIAQTINEPDIVQEEYFIEDFELNVLVTPIVTSYLRIKVQDEWSVTRNYLQSNFKRTESIIREDSVRGNLISPYHLVLNSDDSCDWVYDKISGYIYYKNILEASDEEITLPVFSGANYYNGKVNYIYIDTCTVSINILVEIVQANRINAFWGINEIPVE